MSNSSEVTRFRDTYAPNIESPVVTYYEYSSGIDFDYSNNKYPTGRETGWNWDTVFKPYVHIYKGVERKGHSWTRMKIGFNGIWNLPYKIIPDNFTINNQGTTSERPDASTLPNGSVYYDTTTGMLYIVENNEWSEGVQFKGDSGDMLSIGTTTTLAAGSSATASITGDSPNKVLNLGIPTGATAYAYIAYADDNIGTNFSLIDSTKDYVGFITSTTELTPVVGDFTGKWKKWQGIDLTNLTENYIWIGDATNAATETPTSIVLTGTTALVAGVATINDASITTSSYGFFTPSSTGIYNGNIKYTASAGTITFDSGDIGDTLEFSYLIIA